MVFAELLSCSTSPTLMQAHCDDVLLYLTHYEVYIVAPSFELGTLSNINLIIFGTVFVSKDGTNSSPPLLSVFNTLPSSGWISSVVRHLSKLLATFAYSYIDTNQRLCCVWPLVIAGCATWKLVVPILGCGAAQTHLSAILPFRSWVNNLSRQRCRSSTTIGLEHNFGLWNQLLEIVNYNFVHH